MKIVDVNILLYAVDSNAAQHRSVRAWWEELVNGEEAIGLPWIVLAGFLRIVTNPRIFAAPHDVRSALVRIDRWLALDSVRIVREKEDHWDTLRDLIASAGTAGNLTTDAHLAALAITHDAVLCSTDLDFGRFKGLRWENPLS
ncbi:MAG: type II toxin-antitoxin system VapC family toxin [Burkholderiales bacterium]|nr:type II toxin-antitoxin system VapC family toxin [Burkholderiales bacterium]